jgi:hypothetical protein
LEGLFERGDLFPLVSIRCVRRFDDSTTFCPCGATFNGSSSWDDTSAYSKWEAVHRPHLDDKRGTMAGALAKAETYSKKLTTIDTRFQHAVHLVHADGTSMFLSHAFTVTWKEFVIVFAEHHVYDCVWVRKRIWRARGRDSPLHFSGASFLWPLPSDTATR